MDEIEQLADPVDVLLSEEFSGPEGVRSLKGGS